MDLKVLQINTNRSREAHDMAIHTAREPNATFLLLSEPNRAAVKGRKDWIYDESINSAIKIMDNTVTTIKQGCSKNFSYVTTKNTTIYSCYSCNEDIQELEISTVGNAFHG